ncbi:hypothetical protein C8R45DRAFT_327316 [Mycena sanguinolenta]|nr:hypothetical protein C8R45DRAFT_327316 [Mycena sanguinolenta]
MSLDNSPFVDRLNTNYVPSDSDIFQIRAILVYPENELARIDGRIEEMEVALAQLKEQRASLMGPIAAHKALLSPIRRVAHDVLVEIFLSCLPSEHNALIDPAEAPLLLGHICRHWRCLVYSTPMLWRSIHIPSLDYLQTPPNALSRLEKIVKEWLERSATCSLSVSFFDSTNFVPNLGKHPLILQLLPFSRRLRHLTFTGDAPFLRPILRLDSEDLPLLQTLRTNFPYSIADSLDAFRIPTIRDIALCMPAEPHLLPLPWSQLTKLRLECDRVHTDHGRDGGLDIGGAFDVLRRSPNLIHCELKVNAVRENAKLDISPIVLPHLQTLLLPVVSYHPFDKWGWCLIAPKLRYLQVGYQKVTAKRLPPNQGMRASIDPRYFALSGLHELLQSFPMISHLELPSTARPHDGYGSLLDSLLAFFGPTHEFCPMLSRLVILRPSHMLSDATVLAFVKARMAMATPLKHIRVQFIRPMELDLMPELQSFISDGLEVVLEYPVLQWEFKPLAGLDGSHHRFSH